ncbi:hAT family dimerization protein, partial [Rhizoctonia solani AG-3 Rhs1AP]
MSSIERLLPPNWLAASAESFVNTCCEFYDDTAHSIIQPPPGAKDRDEFGYAMNVSMPQWSHQRQEPTSLAREVQEYLAKPTTVMEPLEWWSKHQLRFPQLAAMARDYLCIPGSSVAVELEALAISLVHRELAGRYGTPIPGWDWPTEPVPPEAPVMGPPEWVLPPRIASPPLTWEEYWSLMKKEGTNLEEGKKEDE